MVHCTDRLLGQGSKGVARERTDVCNPEHGKCGSATAVKEHLLLIVCVLLTESSL
jgi:hypothetical protein